jgi:Fe-S-cluster containining protein
VNLTVWPVEFFAIVEELKAAQIRPVFDASASCGFLKDGLCQIYASRPIICRTHGLPLVYLDDEQDEPAYGVMFCQKNFVGEKADAVDFGPDNTLDMDSVNETLARLHTEFLEAGGESGPDGQGRIALSRLSEFLSIL